MLPVPINLPKWLEENSHLLKPPVNNYCVYNEGFTVMIVGGPNARTDYHINTTPEYFYQHLGSMILKVVDHNNNNTTSSSSSSSSSTTEPIFKDIIINQGDMFLLPANTPHNPVRFANTVGVVIEQRRPEGSVDKMRWYCQEENCKGEVVYEKAFHCTDLGTQIKGAIEEFLKLREERTCKRCGVLAESVPREGSIRDPNLV
ncbi:3-hydroxyanthranilic acid dioxygenase [Poronia punctata]|nr:3-hydroxyanthranilic acid dioxygenase [Poronia punctata]